MSGITAIRNFVLMTLLVAATIAAAGSVAQARFASSSSQAARGTEAATGDACFSAAAIRLPAELGIETMALNPVEVRCSSTVERPNTGAYVSGSAGVTVNDLDGNDIVRFDQPVGRTGADTTGNAVPSVTGTNRTIVPAGVVCAPVVGCNAAVNGPANFAVRVLPGGSATSVGTAGGTTTVNVTETCVNTAGGGCGTSGSPAEVSKVAITRS